MTTAQMSLIWQIITSIQSSVHLKTFIWVIRKMSQISTEVYKLVISLTTPRVTRINSVLPKWFYQLVDLTLLGRNNHWIGSALGHGLWKLESVQRGEAESRESQALPKGFLTLGRYQDYLEGFILLTDAHLS